MAVSSSSCDSARHRRPQHPYAWREIIALILVAAGAAMLGYAGGEYWYMFRSQHRLQTQWERRSLNANPGTVSAYRIAGTRSSHASAADSAGRPTPEVLARIAIPKIQLDAIVLEGVSSRELAVGPGHIAETALPGEAGNAVITAHRDTFFRHILDLDRGDEINIWRDNRLFRYQVIGKKIVKPEDVSVLNPTDDAELTLITCYPVHYIGPAPERLVVFSRLVP